MGGQRGDPHRDERALGRRERTNGRQELVRTGPIHQPQERLSAVGQPDGPLPTVLGLRAPLDEASLDEAVDETAGRRRRPPEQVGEIADRRRAAVRQDIERGQLREPETELAELERDTTPLERVAPPFPRISYTAAIEKLRALGTEVTWGDDLGGDAETLLARQFDRPVCVFNYPREVKAFYMKQNPDDPRTVLNNDCLAPEGYGEIIGGSQREDDHDLLLSRIRQHDLPLEAFQWYLDVRKYGTFPHSGFGMGLERFVAWMCGVPHLREVIPYPRMLYRIYP